MLRNWKTSLVERALNLGWKPYLTGSHNAPRGGSQTTFQSRYFPNNFQYRSNRSLSDTLLLRLAFLGNWWQHRTFFFTRRLHWEMLVINLLDVGWNRTKIRQKRTKSCGMFLCLLHRVHPSCLILILDGKEEKRRLKVPLRTHRWTEQEQHDVYEICHRRTAWCRVAATRGLFLIVLDIFKLCREPVWLDLVCVMTLHL